MSLFLMLLLSLPAFAQEIQKLPEGYFFVNRCMIFGQRLEKVRHLPGERCVFFDNGDFISSTYHHLRYYDKNQKVKWQLDGNFHHQLNLSHDKKRLLVMNSIAAAIGKEKNQRYDELMVVDLDGKILQRESVTSYLTQAGLSPISVTNTLDAEILKVKTEGSHFNSFYEIPPLKPEAKVPSYIRPGNFIINGNLHGFMVLDPHLKTVLFHTASTNKNLHLAHDAQVLSSGKLLYFHNLAATATQDNPHSTINEYDWNTKQTEVLFKANPESTFFSLMCGGVQELDEERILISHSFAGVYVFSRKEKKVLWSSYTLQQDNSMGLAPTQEIKIRNLKKFMRFNK